MLKETTGTFGGVLTHGWQASTDYDWNALTTALRRPSKTHVYYTVVHPVLCCALIFPAILWFVCDRCTADFSEITTWLTRWIHGSTIVNKLAILHVGYVATDVQLYGSVKQNNPGRSWPTYLLCRSDIRNTPPPEPYIRYVNASRSDCVNSLVFTLWSRR